MNVTIRQFAFTDPDFAKCAAIRIEVFVGEQNVPEEEEMDDLDAEALHFLAEQDGVPLGTARVVFKPGMAKIGRVAVLRTTRGLGVGAALIRYAEATAPSPRYVLDAQVQAMAFYAGLGYAPEGEVFMEANIPHQRMSKEV
jgi:predicted GNAT family N-acyltransferase